MAELSDAALIKQHEGRVWRWFFRSSGSSAFPIDTCPGICAFDGCPEVHRSSAEGGELPFRKVGTHRRVLFKDLMQYRAASQARRKNVLDELTREPQELGLGY